MRSTKESTHPGLWIPALGLIAAMWLLTMTDLPAQTEILAIRGGTVLPMVQGAIERGVIVVEEGKISQVGRDIPIPGGATVIPGENCWILPGLIAAHSTIGLREEGRPAALDELSSPNAAALMIIDGVNPFDKSIEHARRAGITTALVASGRGNVIGGQPAVVKTRGRTVTEMTLLSPAGVKFSLGEGPKDAFGDKGRLPSTRMGSAFVVRNALIEAGEYRRKWREYESKEAKDEVTPPKRDLMLEPLAALLDGRLTAFFECYRVDDIMTALRLIDEFKLKALLVGCAEGFRIPEEIARRGIPVIVGPMGIGPKRMETQEVKIENAAILAKAGIKVVIQSDDALGLGSLEELPLAAALAVKGGLDRSAALRAITLTAAEVLGVADRVGSLEPGKDADMVVFDGDPLDYRTRVIRVLIDGKTVYEKN
ncbi:MAG: amidohydrolase family protein [Acidobacteriota bacterium]